MSYYHGTFVKSIGGLKARAVRRLVGETWEEMLTVAGDRPEITVLNAPARGKDSYKSRSIPILWIDANQDDYLDKIGSDEVSNDHILVLTWLLRREIYVNHHEITPEVDAFFEKGIRGSLRELIKKGLWIDHPETFGLKKLNTKLEKIDLGRRSDLKLSSQQPEVFEKYDRDVKRQDFTEEDDVDRLYEFSSPHARVHLRKKKPWLVAHWQQKFGF